MLFPSCLVFGGVTKARQDPHNHGVMAPPSLVHLFTFLVLVWSGVHGRGSLNPRMPSSPTDVRRLLGGGREVRSLEGSRKPTTQMTTGGISIIEGEATPLVLTQVVDQLGGGHNGLCDVLVYYDPVTAPPEKLRMLQEGLGTAVTLVDVSRLAFPLITRSRRRVPLVELLSFQPDTRCRLLLAWSSINYQRGLLLMSRAEPSVLRPQDTLILPVKDHRLDRFLPQIRQRVMVVERTAKQSGRGRRALRPPNFLVEGVCETCDRYSLLPLGEWQYPTGWTWGGASLRRPNLDGALVTVAYTPSVPNIFPMGTGTKTRLEGVELRLLQYAAAALNFTYRLVVPRDGEWGRVINGTWTGKVGLVVTKRADLAVGGLVYTAPRAKATRYSVLFHNERWGIVCPLSVRLPVWPYIMFPFRSDEAPSVFSLLVALHILAYIVVTLVGEQQQDQREPNPLSEAFGRVSRAGVSLYLRFMACLYFWNLFFCFMKPKYEPPLDSSVSLLKSGYDWGIVKGTTVEPVLAASQYPAHRNLATGAQSLTSISSGFQRLREEGLCLVGVPKRYAHATIAMRHTTHCGELGLQVSEEDLHTVRGGWVLPQGSRLAPLLNVVIRRLQEWGMLELWRRELHDILLTRGPRNLPCLNPPLGPLSLPDLRLAFYVLLAGWGIALLIFLSEFVSSGGKFINRIKPVGHHQMEVNTMEPHTTPPVRRNRSSSIRKMLAALLNPIPSLNTNSKEVAFRQQLQAILRDVWVGPAA
ncbi:hypothetical protein Pmani_018900 [Petrolisthes manimaculis]|uniref:Ionotropic glutamate receptor L-glutamate and glycine-binding domain-containing protein n=1 Tax=Petrolisthes manimaculis TaxID=1843537 RepID=A0AAE1U7Y1_9EUCA|nr:hypothetical protein Pmani_018900 [Petrolisthes manimaculis]